VDKAADTDAYARQEHRRAFGDRVRELRKQAGLTQEALAGAAGMDRSFLAEIEGGRTNPSLDTMHRLADALGVDPGAFFAG
jgi:transcriptional regulator with XRE-family HTH domain